MTASHSLNGYTTKKITKFNPLMKLRYTIADLAQIVCQMRNAKLVRKILIISVEHSNRIINREPTPPNAPEARVGISVLLIMLRKDAILRTTMINGLSAVKRAIGGASRTAASSMTRISVEESPAASSLSAMMLREMEVRLNKKSRRSSKPKEKSKNIGQNHAVPFSWSVKIAKSQKRVLLTTASRN